MKKRVTKDIFMKIFSNLEYRKKLDKIILNFFGLDNTKIENQEEIKDGDILLEFTLLLNTEKILKIIIKDTKKMFKASKKFYLNFSYREVEQYHVLLIPCYWEIYCKYAKKYIKKHPKIYLIAALLECTTKEEVKFILNKMEVFTKKEIKDIMKFIPEEKRIISKDK